jgi:hypothetical protein
MQVFASNVGETFDLDQLSAVVLARYAEGKTPALAAKSALQLGLPEDVIVQLPGVTKEALAQGHALIDSGAFPATATGTVADGTFATSLNLASPQVAARLAAGLDPYGFPPAQVALLRAAGTYVEPMTHDQMFAEQVWLHAWKGSEIGTGLPQDFRITPEGFVAAAKTLPYVLHPLLALMESGVTGEQIWAYVQHAAPGFAVELVGVAPQGGGP